MGFELEVGEPEVGLGKSSAPGYAPGMDSQTILWALPSSSGNTPYPGEAERSQLVLGKNTRGSYYTNANLSGTKAKWAGLPLHVTDQHIRLHKPQAIHTGEKMHHNQTKRQMR